MLNKLLNFLCGYCSFGIKTNEANKAVMAFYEKHIVTTIRKDRRGKSRIICKTSDANNVENILQMSGIEILSFRENGLLPIVKRYKKRPGIIFGFVLLLLSLAVSRMFIWQINIVGNDSVTREETIELLREHGVFVGAFTPSLDLHNIYNEILIDNNDFCWISVNIRGTVANVEVRETMHPDKLTPPKGKYANIIAAYDGEITLIESYGGKNVVKVGDAIRAGELLVAGLYEDKMGRTVLSYARGSVYAKIQKDFYIEVPLVYEKKVYTGEREYDFSINLFSKSINILNNSRNNDKEYDIIADNEQILLFDRIYLPLSYSLTTYSSYELQPQRRDVENARRIAYETINREILEFAGDGEILSKLIEESVDGDVYKLTVSACMNTDIAKIQEIVYNER